MSSSTRMVPFEDEPHRPHHGAARSQRHRERALRSSGEDRGAVGKDGLELGAIVRDHHRLRSHRGGAQRFPGQLEAASVRTRCSREAAWIDDGELLTVNECERATARRDDLRRMGGDGACDVGRGHRARQRDRELLQGLEVVHRGAGGLRLYGAPLLAEPEEAADARQDEGHDEVDQPADQVLRVADRNVLVGGGQQPQRGRPAHHDHERGRPESAVPGCERDGREERGVDRLLADARLVDGDRNEDPGSHCGERDHVSNEGRLRRAVRVLGRPGLVSRVHSMWSSGPVSHARTHGVFGRFGHGYEARMTHSREEARCSST